MKHRKLPVEVENGYEMCDSFTGKSYGFCTKIERFTTPLAKKVPLVFKPAIKTLEGWRTITPK